MDSLKTADGRAPAYEQVILQPQPVDEVVDTTGSGLYSSPQDALKARAFQVSMFTSEESQYASPQGESSATSYHATQQHGHDDFNGESSVSVMEKSQDDTPAGGQSVSMISAQTRDLYSKIDPTRRSSTKNHENGNETSVTLEEYEGFGQPNVSGTGRDIMPLPASDDDSLKYATIPDHSLLASGYGDSASGGRLYEEVKLLTRDGDEFAPPSTQFASRGKGKHYAELTFKATDAAAGTSTSTSIPDKPPPLEPEDELLV